MSTESSTEPPKDGHQDADAMPKLTDNQKRLMLICIWFSVFCKGYELNRYVT